MTSINTISPSLIQAYSQFQKTDKLDLEQTFKNLSIEMGGDGSSITKSQLDSYIQKAEDGTVDAGKTKLTALKSLQENWDTIAGEGNDSITFSNMSNYTNIIAMVAIGNTTDKVASLTATTTSSDSSSDSSANNLSSSNIYSYLVGATGASGSSGVTQSDLTTYLKSLLSDSSSTDNSDQIALLTNLIADFQKLSGGTSSITQSSLDSSSGYQA